MLLAMAARLEKTLTNKQKNPNLLGPAHINIEDLCLKIGGLFPSSRWEFLHLPHFHWAV